MFVPDLNVQLCCGGLTSFVFELETQPSTRGCGGTDENEAVLIESVVTGAFYFMGGGGGGGLDQYVHMSKTKKKTVTLMRENVFVCV